MDPLERRLQNDLTPELLSGSPVQTNQIPGLLFLHCGNEINPVSENNGGSMPLTGNGNLPD
jgi:hypothetical protein